MLNSIYGLIFKNTGLATIILVIILIGTFFLPLIGIALVPLLMAFIDRKRRCSKYLILLVCVFIAVRAICFDVFRITSSSMSPNLESGTLILVRKTISNRKYKISNFSHLIRNRIVVVKYNDEYLCKRCIGVSGDSIGINSNTVIINGSFFSFETNFDELLSEGKVQPKTFYRTIIANNLCQIPLIENRPINIGNLKEYTQHNHVGLLLVGDNVTASTDSFNFGLIPKKDLIGVLVCKLIRIHS